MQHSKYTKNDGSSILEGLFGKLDTPRRIGRKYNPRYSNRNTATVDCLRFFHNELLNLCIDFDKKNDEDKFPSGCAVDRNAAHSSQQQRKLVNKILHWNNSNRGSDNNCEKTNSVSDNDNDGNLRHIESIPVDKTINEDRGGQQKKLLELSYRLLSSTTHTQQSFDLSTANFGAIPFYVSPEDSSDYYTNQAMKVGMKIERQVIDTIRSIGEVIILSERVNWNSAKNSSSSIRSDDVFEYFCENSILSLLVDIVEANPLSVNQNATNVKSQPEQNVTITTSSDDVQSEQSKSLIAFTGIVGSAKVKAQVYWTIARLITGLRNTTALYYIMSQNCINHLILSLFPIDNGLYTRSALDIMMPAYLQMIQTLAFQLSSNPDVLFPFFSSVVDHETCSNKGDDPISTLFPLFSAIIGLLRSSCAHSDSFIHSTCMSLTLGLLHLQNGSIQHWIRTSGRRELRHLSDHVCSLLLESHQRIVNLTTGSVVDVVRSKAIEIQLENLQHLIDLINDIFATNIQSLNMILCEMILQRVIFCALLNDMAPCKLGRALLPVGVSDYDVIPFVEASAQVATFILSRLLLNIDFGPFVRMIAVALFHPISTRHLCIFPTDGRVNNGNEFRYTMQLNSIIQKNVPSEDAVPNPFRHAIFSALESSYGEWRVITSVFLLESLLDCAYIDSTTIQTFEVLPHSSVWNRTVKECERSPSSVENSMSKYLLREHNNPKSIVSVSALECVSHLILKWYHKFIVAGSTSNCDFGSEGVLNDSSSPIHSPLLDALTATKAYFFRKTLECKDTLGADDAFMDLFESVVQSMYKTRHTAKNTTTGITIREEFAYHLMHHQSQYHSINCEYLTRKDRGVAVNKNIEYARFYMRMSIHFRAVCNILHSYQEDLINTAKSMSSKSSQDGLLFAPVRGSKQAILSSPRLVDEAGNLSSVFGSLSCRPNPGSVVDLTGLTTFELISEVDDNVDLKKRKETRKKTSAHSSTSVLVLDSTSLFIVNMMTERGSSDVATVTKGALHCWVSLVSIIAIAQDGGRCLHIAVQNEEVAMDNDYTGELNTFIRNGNMILSFESSGTCSLVSQYLDRGRNTARREELNNIIRLLSNEI